MPDNLMGNASVANELDRHGDVFEDGFMPSLDDVLDKGEVTVLSDFVFALVTDTSTALDVFKHLVPVRSG